MKNDDDANDPKSPAKQQQEEHRQIKSSPSLLTTPTTTKATESGQRRVSSPSTPIHKLRPVNVPPDSSRYNAPTISALVRGLHQTGTSDIHTLHLPLFHTDDEEEDEEDLALARDKADKSQLSEETKAITHRSSLLNFHLHHLHSPLSKHHPVSEVSPHSSLPRLIVQIDPAIDNNNCDNGQKLHDSDIPTSPGRRFSQFNFHLRRFSHAHNATVPF